MGNHILGLAIVGAAAFWDLKLVYDKVTAENAATV
jgi:hypothetical protein